MSSRDAAFAFDQTSTARICAYMNERQPSVNLEIVRAHAPDIAVSAAELVTVDSEGALFWASSAQGRGEVRVLWSRPISVPDEVREQMIALFLETLEPHDG